MTVGKPRWTELRKKSRDVDSATMAAIPSARSTRGAGRLEPQPKFLPAITMSPRFTCAAHSGRFAIMQYGATSSSEIPGLAMVIWPGIIKSVLMLSPNFQTRPSKSSVGVLVVMSAVSFPSP